LLTTPIGFSDSAFGHVDGFGAIMRTDSTTSPKEEIEGFYDLWYDFNSWRSYDKETNEGRDKRGHVLG
jgi:hypothetical protein